MSRVEQIIDRLAQSGQSLGCAESCTGGLIAARLTDVPGASRVFRGGVVVYANDLKRVLLDVTASVLETDGAVGAACATSMAEGARHRLKSDWGVATTGIAGPGGATPTKPVGLVFLAVAGPEETRVERNVFEGDRNRVREQAVDRALELLVECLPDQTAS